jgi:glyceraldehyde-3-phosphate dehydrogenase/erythrose-4-phosphate dehydrogenase
MRKKINIAIVGFGNIGSYFYKTLVKQNQMTVAGETLIAKK